MDRVEVEISQDKFDATTSSIYLAETGEIKIEVQQALWELTYQEETWSNN